VVILLEYLKKNGHLLLPPKLPLNAIHFTAIPPSKKSDVIYVIDRMTIKLCHWERKLNVKILTDLKREKKGMILSLPRTVFFCYTCVCVYVCVILFWGLGALRVSLFILLRIPLTPYTDVGQGSRLPRKHRNNLIKKENQIQGGVRPGWDERQRLERIPFTAKKIIILRVTAVDNGRPLLVSSPILLSWNTRKTPMSGI
jgi:hypothetical protein